MGLSMYDLTPQFGPVPDPRPQQTVGGLGGFGGVPQQQQPGFFQSDNFGNVLQALGASLLSSPRNAPLSGFAPALSAFQGQSQARQKDARAQKQEEQERAAMVQALVSSGIDQAQAETLAVNPQAAKLTLDQMQQKQAADASRTQANSTVEFLVKRGIPREDAAFVAQNHDMMNLVMKQNPDEKLTDDMREYRQVVEQGFQGTFMDYMVKMKEAGRQQVNIDTGVKLPTGYQWKDPNNQGAGVVPIAGGPATVLPSEAAGRIGLADSFLDNFDAIRNKVQRGDVTGVVDNFRAKNDSRSPGAETYRQIQTGVDSLQRMLTGAGMPASEAQSYAFRYLPVVTDDASSMVTKLDRLKTELESIKSRVMEGRADQTSAPLPAGTTTNRTSTGVQWSHEP